MKKILMMTVVLCSWMTMMAEPVSPETARQVAAKFMKSKGTVLKSESMRKQRRAASVTDTASAQIEAPAYYIFNATKGFVVVSGDDCVGDNLVLGYSDMSSFDTNDVSSNMQWWLDEMECQISKLSQYGERAKAVELHEDIDRLVTALWDQGSNIYDPHNPYNAFCPVVDGALCVTGCMATALAQVMYYHRYPIETISEPIPGYTMENGMVIDELPVTKFDWDLMVDDYMQETAEEQQLAVAKLMRYCGQSVQMDYTPEIGNGYYYDLDMLVKLFGYDQGVYRACADQYTVSGWDQLIYNELKEGRPLVYGGFSNGGGHAFVVDGYQVQDGSGYYHVNWGWGGVDNGFFKINLLDSHAHGTGSSTTNDGYNLHQDVLIGLQPAQGPLDNYGRYLTPSYWNIAIDGEHNSFQVVNTSYRPGTFNICLFERLADGTMDSHNLAFGNLVDLPSYDPVRETSSYTFYPPHALEGLAAGRHELVFMNKEVGTDAPWKPLYGPNNYIEVVIDEEGNLAETIFHPYSKLSTTVSKIKIDGLKQRGLRQDVSFPLTNKGDEDYIGGMANVVYSLNGSVLDQIVSVSFSGIMIEAGDTIDVTFPISINREGNFVVVMSKEYDTMNLEGTKLSALKNTPGYIGHKTFTLDALRFYCQMAQYNERPDEEDNPAYYLDFMVGNGTDTTYDAAIMAQLFKPNDEGGYDPVVFPLQPFLYSFVRIEKNSWQDVSIRLSEPLETGNYGFQLYMANDFLSDMLDDYFVFAIGDIHVESSTGIESIQDSKLKNINEDAIYNLSGQRLQKMQKGINIVNGKKIWVK